VSRLLKQKKFEEDGGDKPGQRVVGIKTARRKEKEKKENERARLGRIGV
jgi:hypothetical protein